MKEDSSLVVSSWNCFVSAFFRWKEMQKPKQDSLDQHSKALQIKDTQTLGVVQSTLVVKESIRLGYPIGISAKNHHD